MVTSFGEEACWEYGSGSYEVFGGYRLGSDYSPRSGANSYKAGNDDVFSLFHAETD